MNLNGLETSALSALYGDAQKVVDEINQFTSSTFKTRGGRLGSGMGSLLEALWVYFMNRALQNEGGQARLCELAWLPDHQPADFAVLNRNANWNPLSREGELFRIEAKSMNLGVDEAKGHFTNLAKETSEYDQLLVIVWSWESLAGGYVWPKVTDFFIGNSLSVIELRDGLHIARGGTFVQPGACPDGCNRETCTHVFEPLNAAGKRERRTGPASTKPANVEYAANFGGLLRMIKTSNPNAVKALREKRLNDDTCHRYISFIHRHFPSEETSQYRISEWRKIATELGIVQIGLSSNELRSSILAIAPDYQSLLRQLI